MALHVHRSERADGLVDGLADLLAVPPSDPFAEEIVAVPARGLERWLLQQLSHKLGATPDEAGICAGIRFPSPAGIIAELTGGERDDPWSPDRLVWPVLAVIDEQAQQPWCRPLALHLGLLADDGADQGDRRGRRWATARRIAGLFDNYCRSRPDLIAQWTAGQDTDGLGAVLPSDLRWQPPLWRAVRQRMAAPDPVTRLGGELILDGVGDRMSFFGLTRLPPAHQQVLIELARHREVHLWLTHPSAAQWDGLVPPATRRRVSGAAGDVAGVRHPLLASLGRESRELQFQLSGFAVRHHELQPPPDTLLGALQRGIREDRPDVRHRRTDADTSVQVHSCHGAARQVEVLRDALVGLMDRDATLEPRDILVMCPDIETFAPLLQAAFGMEDNPGSHPGHRLRVRLADRALSATNPLLGVTRALLDLATSRVTASQVLDLISRPAVRRRFGLRDDDLETIAGWVAESGVRWGLDTENRAAYRMDTVPTNTWRSGLDRLLLGSAMGPGGMAGDALALDEVGSSEIMLVGKLAELVGRLSGVLERLSGEHPVGQWLDALSDGVDLLTAVPEADRWQVGQVRTEFARIVGDVGAGDAVLGLDDVRALLTSRLAGRPTRANFRTGTLTVCTMVPMRSVPHRVVALLGLDDGVYPRRGIPDGDDVLARTPQLGERSARIEDRQLLLDAILSAGEHLVVTYAGADERTGARRPPAVPLGEVLDQLAATGDLPVEDLITRHSLQAFDVRELDPKRPFSYDPAALAGARAALAPRREPAGFDVTLMPTRAPVVELADLVALLKQPARQYLRTALGVHLVEPEEVIVGGDAIPSSLGGLSRWGVADRVLQDRLKGVPEAECRERELRRGELPPGRLGRVELDRIMTDVTELVERTAALRAADRTSVDVQIPLPDGRSLRGTVPDLYGDRIVRVTTSQLKPPRRLDLWIHHLALSASVPGVGWTAVQSGVGGRIPGNQILPSVSGPEAGEILQALVTLYDHGLQRPLPMAAESSYAYAWSRLSQEPEPALEEARRSFTSRYGEGRTAENQDVWGPDGFDAMLASPLEVDGLPDGVSGEPTVFGRCARTVWDPLLRAEQLRHRLTGGAP